MTRHFKQFSLALVAVGTFSQPAFSQALATEVVDEFFAQMTRGGMAVAPGSVTTTGKTVEWKDVTIGLPEGQGSFSINFIRAEEIGGGKVSLSYPETMSFVIDPKGEQPQLNIAMNTKGLTHIVSGQATARDHDYSADSMMVDVTSPKPGLMMKMNISDLIGSQQTTMKGEGENAFAHFAGTFKAATVGVDYVLKDDEVNMSSKGTYNNVSGLFDMDEVSQTNLDALTNGERNMTVNLAIESTAATVDVDQPDMSMLIDVTTGAGTANYGVVDGIAQMSGEGYDAKYNITLKNLPLPPFQLSVAKADMIFNMPLVKVDDPMPARFKFGFDGLVASDTVWGMIDPTGKLSRDAARLNLDLSADMRWLKGVEEAVEMESVPVEVNSVKINDLTLEIAGAKFNGTGAATLDNSTMPPTPVGAVDLDLKGGMGLLDNLVAIGLLPQQYSMMAKGMAGVFTVPGGNGTDHLTSKIEMKEGGSILANGQPIQ